MNLAKCAGEGCPIRETCERFSATPGLDRKTWLKPTWEWRVTPRRRDYPARWNPCQCMDWKPIKEPKP